MAVELAKVAGLEGVGSGVFYYCHISRLDSLGGDSDIRQVTRAGENGSSEFQVLDAGVACTLDL